MTVSYKETKSNKKLLEILDLAEESKDAVEA